uniref:39S ribosomal protein L52, mitochondrial n=1 Tax=Parastrongyloides trichosuri TaxID=131310 RepID=A0A0N4ZCY6_PARTI
MNTTTQLVRTVTTKVSKFPMNINTPGRYQNWRSPVYVSPHISPLQKGPDYSFQDGRQLMFTSKAEIQRKYEQVELAKKIVQYLGDIKEMEDYHVKEIKNKEQIEAEFIKWTPKAKGIENIF